MADENLRELVRMLSQSKIVLAGDVSGQHIYGIDVDLLASKIIESKRESTSALNIIGLDEVRKIIDGLKVDKTPMPIEVIRSADFNPAASDIDAEYRITNKPIERTEGTTADFVSYFNSRLRKIKLLIEGHRNFEILPSLEALKGLTAGREVSIAGMVANKFVTKKGNMMIVIEDETAEAKVMIMNGTSQQAKDLFEKAGNIIDDEVIAIKGKLSGPFVIANETRMARCADKAEEGGRGRCLHSIHVRYTRWQQEVHEKELLEHDTVAEREHGKQQGDRGENKISCDRRRCC